MHLYSLEALCPLFVPHPSPPCGVVPPPRRRCVLPCSDPVERAGLAGGGAGGKEGPHPWKLCGDAVKTKWKYLWTLYYRHQGYYAKMCVPQLNSQLFASSDNAIRYCWETILDTQSYAFWLAGRLVLLRHVCFVGWIFICSSIHKYVTIVIAEWDCTYDVLLYMKAF